MQSLPWCRCRRDSLLNPAPLKRRMMVRCHGKLVIPDNIVNVFLSLGEPKSALIPPAALKDAPAARTPCDLRAWTPNLTHSRFIVGSGHFNPVSAQGRHAPAGGGRGALRLAARVGGARPGLRGAGGRLDRHVPPRARHRLPPAASPPPGRGGFPGYQRSREALVCSVRKSPRGKHADWTKNQQVFRFLVPQVLGSARVGEFSQNIETNFCVK